MPATWVQLVRANVLLGCCSLGTSAVSLLALYKLKFWVTQLVLESPHCRNRIGQLLMWHMQTEWISEIRKGPSSEDRAVPSLT